MLWIAFRIVFLLMIPNWLFFPILLPFVVNCFQNCIFTYDSQQRWWTLWGRICCELLSELYFYLWFPTLSGGSESCFPLWIAFRIVFLLMIPNECLKIALIEFVVNCFQNCIFTYDSQPWFWWDFICTCCELLSELYFYLWFPTLDWRHSYRTLLWIAFRIVFLLMIPNPKN